MDRKQVKALFDGLSPEARAAFNSGGYFANSPHPIAEELVAAGLLERTERYVYSELARTISDPDARPGPVDLADEIDACTEFESISSWKDTDALSEYRVDPDAAARLVNVCLTACMAAKAALVAAIRALPEVE